MIRLMSFLAGFDKLAGLIRTTDNQGLVNDQFLLLSCAHCFPLGSRANFLRFMHIFSLNQLKDAIRMESRCRQYQNRRVRSNDRWNANYRSFQPGRNNRQTQSSPRRCFNCGNPGHITRYCQRYGNAPLANNVEQSAAEINDATSQYLSNSTRVSNNTLRTRTTFFDRSRHTSLMTVRW